MALARHLAPFVGLPLGGPPPKGRDMTDEADYRGLTADIVAAYVTKNHVSLAELPNLITAIHNSLLGAGAGAVTEPAAPATPMVSPRKAVQPDAITCMTCGRKFKSLKRHLRTDHHQTPDEYRGQWGLPESFPMVAPEYSASRSTLAKMLGLGRKAEEAREVPVGAGRDAPPPQAATPPASPPKRRARAPKS